MEDQREPHRTEDPATDPGEALAELLAQHGAARYADVDALLPHLPADRRRRHPSGRIMEP